MAQGWSAVLWVSLGFFIGLFWSRAKRCVRRRECTDCVPDTAGFTSCDFAWAVIVLVVGFVWPSAAAWFEGNGALTAGLWLGVVGILLSALSSKSRADFNADFDLSYRQFYVHRTGRRRRHVSA